MTMPYTAKQTAARLTIAAAMLSMVASAYVAGYFMGFRQAWHEASIETDIRYIPIDAVP